MENPKNGGFQNRPFPNLYLYRNRGGQMDIMDKLPQRAENTGKNLSNTIMDT